MRKRAVGTVSIAAVAAILVVSVIAFNMSNVTAAPANKTVYGDVGMGVLADESGWKTIAAAKIKTSTPSDLIVSHNQECAIHTELNLNQDNEDLTSAVREDVRLIIDEDYDNPVPATITGGESDNGIITMCGRAYHIDTNVLSSVYELCQFAENLNDTDDAVECDEGDIYFNTYIGTKAAHSWDWIVQNVGAGEHTIEVQAMLFDELDAGKGSKKDSGNDKVDTILTVGKRNLIIQEDKLAN